MDSFPRLILALALALFACSQAFAYGEVPKNGSTERLVYTCEGVASSKSITPEAACNIVGYHNPTAQDCLVGAGTPDVHYEAGTTVTVVTAQTCLNGGCSMRATTTTCGSSSTSDVRAYSYSSATESVPACPASGIAINERCGCPLGSKPNPVSLAGGAAGSVCVPIDCKADIDSAVHYDAGNSVDQVLPSESMDLTQCLRGCNVQGSAAVQYNGGMYLVNPHASGGYCDGGAVPGPLPANELPSNRDGTTVGEPPMQVPKGKCPGTVNGAMVYVACDQTVTGSKSQENSSDGSSSKTDKKTTCDASGCTTVEKITKTNPDGSAGGTTTRTTIGADTQDKNSIAGIGKGGGLCTGPDCGGGGGDPSWGGTCEAGFQCTGDAVQCAMAQDQYKRNCEIHDLVSAASIEGRVAASAGAQPAWHPASAANVLTRDLSSGFDQTDLVGGGCPADTVVSIGSARSITIPFSQLCAPAALLGNILVGLTALVCLGIAFSTKGA